MQTMLEETGVAFVPHRACAVARWKDGRACAVEDPVAEEVPVALVYNGISHAVMLATPQDLEDFALGFSLTEGILGSRGDLFDIEIRSHQEGIELDLRVAGGCEQNLRARRRTLAGRTGCGLCGIESLEQAQCRPHRVAAGGKLTTQALETAAAGLARMQRLHQSTGATHAAAWCAWDGEVACVREDVGRHNALDKLVGALAAARESFEDGFVLTTSRASYEIVCKASAMGIRALAAVSAPTAMAVRVADEAGITLIGFVRDGRCNVYSHAGRMAA